MKSGHRNDKDRFLAVLKINIILFVGELIMGYVSGSLSMISDGFHATLHVFASLIALISESQFFLISKEKIKFWSAMSNLILFFPLAFVIAYEANERLANPPAVELTPIFLLVAVFGLLANVYAVLILRPHLSEKSSDNKNKLLLYIHMIFDTLGSIIVLFGALLIIKTGNYVIDPIASFILAGLIILAAIWMSREFFHGHHH